MDELLALEQQGGDALEKEIRARFAAECTPPDSPATETTTKTP
jgi:hypothetical protein